MRSDLVVCRYITLLNSHVSYCPQNRIPPLTRQLSVNGRLHLTWTPLYMIELLPGAGRLTGFGRAGTAAGAGLATFWDTEASLGMGGKMFVASRCTGRERDEAGWKLGSGRREGPASTATSMVAKCLADSAVSTKIQEIADHGHTTTGHVLTSDRCHIQSQKGESHSP